MMAFGGRAASLRSGGKYRTVTSTNYIPNSLAVKRAIRIASLQAQLGLGKKKKRTSASSASETATTEVQAQAEAEAAVAQEQSAWVKPVLVVGGVVALLGAAYYLGKRRK